MSACQHPYPSQNPTCPVVKLIAATPTSTPGPEDVQLDVHISDGAYHDLVLQRRRSRQYLHLWRSFLQSEVLKGEQFECVLEQEVGRHESKHCLCQSFSWSE